MTLGPSRVVGYLLLTLKVCGAVRGGAWQPTAQPLPASFQMAIAVTLGRLQLPLTQVRSLRVGDVVSWRGLFRCARQWSVCGWEGNRVMTP